MPFHKEATRKIQSLRLKMGAGKLRALKRERERQEALAFQRELIAKEQRGIAKARTTAPRKPSTTARLLKATGKATLKGLDTLTKPKPVRRRIKRGRRGGDFGGIFDMPEF